MSDREIPPNRCFNRDFFQCDILDAAPKDDMSSMEHPIFSLSTKPDTNIRYYEHNGNTLEVIPSVLGLATIWDKDILTYCISQIVEGLNSVLMLIEQFELLLMTCWYQPIKVLEVRTISAFRLL